MAVGLTPAGGVATTYEGSHYVDAAVLVLSAQDLKSKYRCSSRGEWLLYDVRVVTEVTPALHDLFLLAHIPATLVSLSRVQYLLSNDYGQRVIKRVYNRVCLDNTGVALTG